jgi:hypothetical protein
LQFPVGCFLEIVLHFLLHGPPQHSNLLHQSQPRGEAQAG